MVSVTFKRAKTAVRQMLTKNYSSFWLQSISWCWIPYCHSFILFPVEIVFTEIVASMVPGISIKNFITFESHMLSKNVYSYWWLLSNSLKNTWTIYIKDIFNLASQTSTCYFNWVNCAFLSIHSIALLWQMAQCMCYKYFAWHSLYFTNLHCDFPIGND